MTVSPEPARDGAGTAADHLGWVFDGAAEFAGRVASFLAEGWDRGERLMVVTDNPRVGQWPQYLLDRRDLLVLSTAEVYGPDRLANTGRLRDDFDQAVAEAVTAGYHGLRVAADNTSLTLSDDRLAAWLVWEAEAEALVRSRPITRMCAFDRSRAGQDTLAALVRAHPIAAFRTPSAGTTPHRGREWEDR